MSLFFVMDSESQNEIKRLFQMLVDLDRETRLARLDELAPDAAIRAEVEALLAEHDRGSDALSRLLVDGGREDPAHAPTALETPRALEEFEVLREIGRGGMAVVYLARDTKLERLVALKVLPEIFTRSEVRVARFRHEAKAVARLNHRGIAAVYRTGVAAGRHFIAMEFVEGTTFAAEIKATQQRTDDETAAVLRSEAHIHRVCGVVAQVADALEHAHQHGIIHRDVKPSNVLIDLEGNPHVADFGVAKNLAEPDMTTTGELAGTCLYMSPEQAAARSTTIDLRSDVFSMGVVLYEALTLEQPFRDSSPQAILHAVQTRQPRHVRALNPGVSKDLETVVHKALEKEPAHRYQTAAHLAADLRCAVAGLPILARPPHPIRKMRLWAQRHRRPAVAALMAVLVLAIVAMAAVIVDQVRNRLCTVEIETAAGDVLVGARRFDEVTLRPGPSLWAAPRSERSHRLAPGLYRFTVTSGADFAEVTVLLEEPGTTTTVRAPILPTAEVTRDMILVPAGTHTLGADGTGNVLTDTRQVELAAFWLDRSEVSVADFRQFLAATEYPPHETWPDMDDPALDERPVVGMSQAAARAYAAWRGKRLPTRDEWEAAARAPDGRLLPWGDGPAPQIVRVPPEDVERYQTYRLPVLLDLYRKWTRPVHDDGAVRSALGFDHMWTNVDEWVDNVHFSSSNARVTKGGWWNEVPNRETVVRFRSMPATKGSIKLGFRCARSAGAG